MSGAGDEWIRRTTIGCVGMLALIAGIVSCLHMRPMVELHGQPGRAAALMQLSGGRDDRRGIGHASCGLAVWRAVWPAWPGRRAAHILREQIDGATGD